MLTSKIIKEIISKFDKRLKPKMTIGEKYYKGENVAISEREMQFYNIARGRTMVDYGKANNKLASGFTGILVRQKVGYLINKNMTITPTVKGMDIAKMFDVNGFKKATKKIGVNASIKTYGVLQWYIDKDKQLKSKVIPSEQIIVINDDDYDDLNGVVLRHYEIKGYDVVESYDGSQIETWMKADNEKDYVLMNQEPNLVMSRTANGNVISTESIGWGKPPFSILYNNDEHTNDLSMFKAYVDVYDFVESDFTNNLEDYQEMYWVLKNYSGTDAESFMEEFKKSRILKVGDGGDATQVAQEVPYAAREALLTRIRHDIFTFAMGVDVEGISGETTNVTIKALFANLDLKANEFEMELEEYFEQSMYFVNKYLEVTGKQAIEATLSLTRNKILNESQAIDDILKQAGFRAKKILLELMPGVTDVEAELAALAEEEAANQSLIDSFEV